MPNGLTHQAAGAAAGVIGYLLDDNPEPGAMGRLVLALLVGVQAAKLPDKLEPATSPHHRQFFHSILVLCVTAFAVKRILKWKPEETWKKLLKLTFLVAGLAYLSHLLLDAMTPMSIPLVGKP